MPDAETTRRKGRGAVVNDARKAAVAGLRKAAGFLRTHRWGTGNTYNPRTDSYCALGALGVGLYGHYGHGYKLHERVLGLVALKEIDRTLMGADAVPLDPRRLMIRTYRWNDDAVSGSAEVIAVFEDTANRIEKELAEEGDML